MTRPIYEPTLARTDATLGYGSDQLFRRPVPKRGCCPAWMTVYDNFPYGQDISSADGTTNTEYPFCDWSDNAAGIFSYVRTASTIGASNNYNITLLVDGVYSLTWSEVSESTNANNYLVKYFIDPTMNYPGRSSSLDPVDQVVQTMDFEDAAGTARSYALGYYYSLGTIVLPFKRFNSNPGTIYPYIQILKPVTASDVDITFNNRLWVTYHGPLEHAAAITANNDPYPTTP